MVLKKLLQSVYRSEFIKIILQVGINLLAKLQYKEKCCDFTLYKVEKYFLSGKLCNFCNYENVSLRLSDIKLTCVNYRALYNRDINKNMNLKIIITKK